MENKTIEIASTHLGKKSVGSELYDKSLLVAVPRVENRTTYNIDENNLPFVGYDIWDAYEVSFMTTNHVPVNYVLKLKYPCTSPYIVESKSLKLYLNSFNMTPLKDTIKESTEYFINTVKKDLSELLETDIELTLHKKITSESKMFQKYQNISDLIDLETIKCETFKETPEVLESVDKSSELNITFDCLRSNCRVTKQSDWADLFIHIKANKSITLESLFKYLVSFRKEYHFHEECVEMIYKRLWDKLNPEELAVTALYTRRGGIDICPTRANKVELLETELLDTAQYTRRTVKQ